MNVCVGGTFNPLHKGHKELLRTAFRVAESNGSVFIGVTSSKMAQKNGRIASFEKRKQAIMQFLKDEHLIHQVRVKQIFDAYGPTLEEDYDAIIVSPETEPIAKEINQKRKHLGKTPLQIIVVPFVLSDDGKPISSTRIRRKEIDENGLMITQE